ncbi:reverse transcriptase zinc-binding domain-containing protein [Tanacetum coccineum]
MEPMTTIWYDNWHLLGPLSNVVTKRDIYDARMTDKCTVKEAINRGNWNWPSDWAGKFPILSNYGVPNLKESEGDVTKWKDNNGKLVTFSVKQAWKDRIAEGLKVNWKDMVWYTQCIPKHAFVLWMAVQGRLLTQDRMIKWNPNAVLKCPLCDECSDSHDHLFFKCKYSELVWKKMQTKLCRKFSMNWQTVIEEMSQLRSSKNIWCILSKMVKESNAVRKIEEQWKIALQRNKKSIVGLALFFLECYDVEYSFFYVISTVNGLVTPERICL